MPMSTGVLSGNPMPSAAASDLGAMLVRKRDEEIKEMARRKKQMGGTPNNAILSPAYATLSGQAGY